MRALTPIVIHTSNEDVLLRTAAARSPFDMEMPAATMVQGLDAARPAAPATVQPRLIGTVVQGRDSGFVMMDIPDEGMKVVRVGEKAGTLRLLAVHTGEAQFADPRGARVTLRSPLATDTRP